MASRATDSDVAGVRVDSLAIAPISPARNDPDGLRVLAVDAQHLADALFLASLGVPDMVVRRGSCR